MTLRINKIKSNVGIIHFIGIGGIGMSGIAVIFYNLGYTIQGSDLRNNYNTERLKSLGIKIFYDHNAYNIHNVEYIVISSAIDESNIELQEARKRKIPIIKRSEMLAELMRLKTSIAVSGSHGKTTTTSLIASIFDKADLSPTVINGGIINKNSTNAYIGKSNFLIAEADESDATFIHIPATIGVITNIDYEHLDFYKNFDNLVSAFYTFILNLPFYGFAVACIDNEEVYNLTKKIAERKIITYGINNDNAHILAYNIELKEFASNYDIKIRLPSMLGDIIIKRVHLPIPGIHNIYNSLAAISIAAELNLGIQVIQSGFHSFNGVKRRFTKVGNYKSLKIIDDYAHHPVEISATLSIAKNIVSKSGEKITVVFQPHRYSRLSNLLEEFAKSLSIVDAVYITDVYTAGETYYNVDSTTLVKAIKKYNNKINVEYISNFEKLISIIQKKVIEPTLLLFMGAGDITNWAYKIYDQLKNT